MRRFVRSQHVTRGRRAGQGGPPVFVLPPRFPRPFVGSRWYRDKISSIYRHILQFPCEFLALHGRGKSDSAIVAVKPTNNAERSAAEPVEPRAETKGNAEQQSTCRAQNRISVSQALDRMRQALAVWTRGRSRMRESCTYGSGGGRSVMSVPTATDASSSPFSAARQRGRSRRARSSL